MELSIYQLDAFTDKLFQGNPAAVCPLPDWLPDCKLQAIAEENNLSETAFFVPGKEDFHIRWFTPSQEVDLCGHATLASAQVIFQELGHPRDKIQFQSKSGKLLVQKNSGFLTLDFPAIPPEPVEPPGSLIRGLNKTPLETRVSLYYLAVFESPEEIQSIQPDFQELGNLEPGGIAVTSRGGDVDFLSRFFAPGLGVNEDPVTGSAHSVLTPYWSNKLGKLEMTARQLSKRTGELRCELKDDRVFISGKVTKYLQGTISFKPQ